MSQRPIRAGDEFMRVAKIYVEDGISEASLLHHFEYRKGRSFEDVAKMFLDAAAITVQEPEKELDYITRGLRHIFRVKQRPAMVL